MSIFLNPDEIAELTGYTMPSKQTAWLHARAWVFEISRLGHVKVLRKYAEMRLGMPVDAAPNKPTEPDFSSLMT